MKGFLCFLELIVLLGDKAQVIPEEWAGLVLFDCLFGELWHQQTRGALTLRSQLQEVSKPDAALLCRSWGIDEVVDAASGEANVDHKRSMAESNRAWVLIGALKVVCQSLSGLMEGLFPGFSKGHDPFF
jgi:hypothetical protein